MFTLTRSIVIVSGKSVNGKTVSAENKMSLAVSAMRANLWELDWVGTAISLLPPPCTLK